MTLFETMRHYIAMWKAMDVARYICNKECRGTQCSCFIRTEQGHICALERVLDEVGKERE